MTKFAYFEGAIRPIEEAKVSVMTHAFNYGTGWFGGLRGYWNAEQEQLYVFRIRDHYLRFLDSGKILMANVDETVDDLIRATVDLLQREGYREDCYIRPLGYKADAMIGVRLHNLHDRITIFTTPFGRYIEDEEGARVCVSSWRRVDDTALPPRGKIVGSYVNSALIKSEAVLNGFDEALVLNHDGHVAEGSAENFFIVRGDSLITPPIHAHVLEGITREILLQIIPELGLPLRLEAVSVDKIAALDEAAVSGSSRALLPVVEIAGQAVGDGRPGPLTRRILAAYHAFVAANVKTAV